MQSTELPSQHGPPARAEDFLAGEEDAGDEGGGADPNDLMDYAGLAAPQPGRGAHLERRLRGDGASEGGEASDGADSDGGSLPSVLLDGGASAGEGDDSGSQGAPLAVVLLPLQRWVRPGGGAAWHLRSLPGCGSLLCTGHGGRHQVPRQPEAPAVPASLLRSCARWCAGASEDDAADSPADSLENVNPFALASGSDGEVGEPADGYADEGLPEGAPHGM